VGTRRRSVKECEIQEGLPVDLKYKLRQRFLSCRDSCTVLCMEQIASGRLNVGEIFGPEPWLAREGSVPQFSSVVLCPTKANILG
jgi:hypothetical protein